MEAQHWIIVILIVSGLILTISLLWNRNIVSSTAARNADGRTIGKIIGAYRLPETWLKIESEVAVEVVRTAEGELSSARIVQQTFKLSSLTRASSASYFLQFHANPFAYEEVNVVISDAGLLETAKVVSDDQTAKIISLVASAPAAILPGDDAMTHRFRETVSPRGQITIEKFSASFELRAWDTGEGASVPWKLPIGLPEVSVDAGFSVKSDIDRGGMATSRSAVAERLHGLVFPMRTTATVVLTPSSPLVPISIPGLVFLDQDNLFCVPIRTVPFGKRTQAFTIKNGELRSHELVNPSVVKGIINIPIDLAKAIVSIPAQLISFRIDMVKKQKDYETATLELKQAIDKSETYQAEALKKERALRETEQKLMKAEAAMQQLKADCNEEFARLDKIIEELKRGS